MELPLETQLIASNGTAEEDGREEMCRVQHLAAIARYLKAVDPRNEELRHGLVARVSEEMHSQGSVEAQIDWQCLITAVDQVLAAEHGVNAAGDPQIASRGRIAQSIQDRTDHGMATIEQLTGITDWGTPVKCPCPMPEQELSLRRPRLRWLRGPRGWRFHSWRPAQSLMLGLFCLAVVLVA